MSATLPVKRPVSPSAARNKDPKVRKGVQDSASNVPDEEWTGIALSPEWRSVGPFPAGMCEQPFGPAVAQLCETGSALSVQAPQASNVPSDQVKVAKCDSHQQAHDVTLAYPREIWQGPMEATGDSALQWQALAFTTFEVRSHNGEQSQPLDDTSQPERQATDPRKSPDSPNCSTAPVLPDVISAMVTGAQEFAILHADDWQGDPTQVPQKIQWYCGDLYGYTESSDTDSPETQLGHGHCVPLREGVYRILVRLVYEVRLLGKPAADRSEVEMTFRIGLGSRPHSEEYGADLIEDPPFFVYPSIVMGRFASPFVSFGLVNTHPTAALRIVSVEEASSARPVLSNVLYEPQAIDRLIPPCTTRKITFQVGEAVDVLYPPAHGIDFCINYERQRGRGENYSNDGNMRSLTLHMPLDHVNFRRDGMCAYRYTYLSGGSAQYAIVVAPRRLSAGEHTNILALHGAGVEADSAAWRLAIRRQEAGWILLPSGLTTWGLDWTMASKEAYKDLLDAEWYSPLTSRKPSAKFYLIGHSNGGQGVLHALTHMTDSFQGGLIAAGYLNMQEYVNSNWQHARNVSDPTLRGILQSALSVFSNDLYASHLVNKPVTIKYGEQDDNVPPYHSRLLSSLISQWARKGGNDGDSRSPYPNLIAVAGKGHWWNEVLSSPDVQHAIADSDSPVNNSKQIVVSTVVPSEMGYVHGIRIIQTEIPGRLARVELSVESEGQALVVTTANALGIGIKIGCIMTEFISTSTAIIRITVDGEHWEPFEPLTHDSSVYLRLSETGWEFGRAEKSLTLNAEDEAYGGRLLCPISLFLSAPRRILAVIPSSESTTKARSEAYKSVAERWAYAVLLYTTINVYVIEAEKFEPKDLLPHDYVVFLGGPFENPAVSKSAISFIGHHASEGPGEMHEFSIYDRPFSEGGTALLYSIPHPLRPTQDKAMVMTGIDLLGIERAGRLLPVRTGVALPEWIVVGNDADWFGAGGILGAGWYDYEWKWSPEMSYL